MVESMSDVVRSTTFFTLCKNCKHTRDWHHVGDMMWSSLFGIELGSCHRFERGDETLPFWKRKKVRCECKEFE